jgi:hypothetical protein
LKRSFKIAQGALNDDGHLRLEAAALSGGQELFRLARGEVYPVIGHFVQFSGKKSARAFRHGAEGFLKYGQLGDFVQFS